jgi:hypothetical protein
MKYAVPIVLAASLYAVQTGVTQPSGALWAEGSVWVQTANGTVSASAATRLRIYASGNVILRGDSGDRVVYTLNRRMRARSEEEARELLRGFEVKTTTRGDWIFLVLKSPDMKTINADVSVTVPRSMREALIETSGGNVQAYDFDGRVEAQTRGGQVQLDRIKEGAIVRAGGGNIVIGHVQGPVKCFSGGGSMQVDSVGGESWFETVGGEILVKEVLGPIHVTTGAGNIRIGRSTVVFARTAGGVIEVDEATGNVSAQNSGGAIQVNAANGVHCESNSGAIRLRNVDGALQAATAAGNIIAQLMSGKPILDSFLSTGSGDITVFIPSNLAMTVVARNESAGMAKIVSDFPQIRPRQDRGPSMPLVAEGAINGGGPVLRLLAKDGAIYLRREK